MYDLGIFATRPLDQPLVRRLVVLKLWQARDRFDAELLLRKFKHGTSFDWDDLVQLLHKAQKIDTAKVTADYARGFRLPC